ncbi:MAG: phosphate signaling complex protein PhoU [Planctomycetaceae bacterium]|jgi:phosphate transport system protein|nr:phosphate signaling complex protein PhoU [Planctomycetaceae bacterium]
MSKHFARDYSLIHQQLLDLFAIVEKMVNESVMAVCEKRHHLVDSIRQANVTVDQMEVAIEESCLKSLALFQPVAVELRRLATMMKINGELERIAHLARQIAGVAYSFRDSSRFPVPAQLPEMSANAVRMVGRSLDSFVNLDTRLAREVIRHDNIVDEMHRVIEQELVQKMKQEPNNIEPALSCFSVSKHLERIADHAVKIAEDVIYLVDGDIIRHRNQQFGEPPLNH